MSIIKLPMAVRPTQIAAVRCHSRLRRAQAFQVPKTVFGPDTLITHRLANPIPYLNLEVPQHVLDVLKSNGASPSTSNRSDAARDCRFGAEPLTLKCQLNLISLATRKSRPTFESQSRAPRSPLTSPTLSQPLTFHTAPTQREEKRP